jgi:hypothetical protein
MARFQRWAAAALFVVGCNPNSASSSSSEGGAPGRDTAVALMASPTNPNANFHEGDYVAVLEDNGELRTNGVVEAPAGKLVFLPNHQTLRHVEPVWLPVAEAGKTTGSERTAERGYRVSLRARGWTSKYFPASAVFAAPWHVSRYLKVGDSFVERRFGNWEPKKCVVTELSPAPWNSVWATCDGARRDVKNEDILAKCAPAKPGEIGVGDIVYVDKMNWAVVVGLSGSDVVVRQTGFPPEDKAVPLGRVERIR